MTGGGQGIESNARIQRQEALHHLIDGGRQHSRLPNESITFVAPKNSTVKPLDKLEFPAEMNQTMEDRFAANVAQALGFPSGLVSIFYSFGTHAFMD